MKKVVSKRNFITPHGLREEEINWEGISSISKASAGTADVFLLKEEGHVHFRYVLKFSEFPEGERFVGNMLREHGFNIPVPRVPSESGLKILSEKLSAMKGEAATKVLSRIEEGSIPIVMAFLQGKSLEDIKKSEYEEMFESSNSNHYNTIGRVLVWDALFGNGDRFEWLHMKNEGNIRIRVPNKELGETEFELYFIDQSPLAIQDKEKRYKGDRLILTDQLKFKLLVDMMLLGYTDEESTYTEKIKQALQKLLEPNQVADAIEFDNELKVPENKDELLKDILKKFQMFGIKVSNTALVKLELGIRKALDEISEINITELREKWSHFYQLTSENSELKRTFIEENITYLKTVKERTKTPEELASPLYRGRKTPDPISAIVELVSSGSKDNEENAKEVLREHVSEEGMGLVLGWIESVKNGELTQVEFREKIKEVWDHSVSSPVAKT